MIHILIPYDFSKMATHALDFVTQLSSPYTKLHLTLIHVIEYPLNTSVGTLGGGMDPLSDYAIATLGIFGNFCDLREVKR